MVTAAIAGSISRRTNRVSKNPVPASASSGVIDSFPTVTVTSFVEPRRSPPRPSRAPTASAVERLPGQRLVRFCDTSQAFRASTAAASPATSSKHSIMTACVAIGA